MVTGNMTDLPTPSPLLEMTADIVAAYVSNNDVKPTDLPALIESVHMSVTALALGPQAEDLPAPVPAVPIDESLTEEYIICLEDGKPFKSLKRHLRTKFDLTPQAYREKWGLPHDYPMVAPSYAKERSKLAKKMGLGRAATESDAV
jgi:predicted transcriptional regulator